MSQEVRTPLSSRIRQPLDSVGNDCLNQLSPSNCSLDLLLQGKFIERQLSPIFTKAHEECGDCKINYHRIEALQSALLDVIQQNEALKARVTELEATVNAAHDEPSTKRRSPRRKKTKTECN